MKNNLKNAVNAINAINDLFEEIKQLVIDNGRIIDTQKKGCDRINAYIIEGHGEIYECNVMGIKVKENHLFILADYGSNYTFGETDIKNTNDYEWFKVNIKEMLIEQTILSIAESIEQYISKK